MFRQAGNHILRRRMGQTANHRINILPIHGLHPDQGRQVKAGKLRIERTIGFAGLGIAGQRSNLDMRMTGQQAHSINTGIARCANHANFQPLMSVITLCSPVALAAAIMIDGHNFTFGNQSVANIDIALKLIGHATPPDFLNMYPHLIARYYRMTGSAPYPPS